MNSDHFKKLSGKFLNKWWCTLLLFPFIYYTVDQTYMALNYNIFYAINYDYPFLLNIVYIFVATFVTIIHEAGHTFFGIFGNQFIYILGGSLFQVLLPAIIVAYFWVNRQKIGIQFSFALLGFSWVDVSSYAADAVKMQLPLIGGLGNEAHDWHNMLAGTNTLYLYMTLAWSFFALGLLCYLAALILPLFYKEYKAVNLNLKLG